MALTRQDFAMTDEQIEAINRHVQTRSRECREANDYPDSPQVTVQFEFWVMGRDITVYFDSEVNGHQIESAC